MLFKFNNAISHRSTVQKAALLRFVKVFFSTWISLFLRNAHRGKLFSGSSSIFYSDSALPKDFILLVSWKYEVWRLKCCCLELFWDFHNLKYKIATRYLSIKIRYLLGKHRKKFLCWFFIQTRICVEHTQNIAAELVNRFIYRLSAKNNKKARARHWKGGGRGRGAWSDQSKMLLDGFNGKYMSSQSFMSCECMSSNGILSGMSLLNCAIHDYMHLLLHCFNNPAPNYCWMHRMCTTNFTRKNRVFQEFTRIVCSVQYTAGAFHLLRVFSTLLSRFARSFHIILIAFVITAFSSLGLKFSFGSVTCGKNTHEMSGAEHMKHSLSFLFWFIFCSAVDASLFKR